MSNKTQLQTNNTALASLTDRVLAAKDTAAALPDAGGGGGSVETCTVNLSGVSSCTSYFCTVDENGNFALGEPTWTGGRFITSGVIENVICGSLIVLIMGDVYIEGGTAVLLHRGSAMVVVKAPTVAGEECYISF